MMAERSRDCSGGCSGVENHHLPFFHHTRRRACHQNLLLAMKLFLLQQSRIFECPLARWQGASMCTMNLSCGMKILEIFANGYLRRAQVPRQFGDQHATDRKSTRLNSSHLG